MQNYSEDSMYRLLVQSVTDYAIYMLTLDGLVHSWNAGAERVKGYSPDEVLGAHFSLFYTEADRACGLPERALQIALEQGRFEGQGWRVRKNGECFWAQVLLQPVHGPAGEPIGFAKITRDITEKKQFEDQVAHLAHHDSLTALLNRASFRDAMERVLRQGQPCVLLSLDLDRFKPINDTLGHVIGDQVLATTAERIRSQLRKTDIGGRLGGDEFGVLLTGCTSQEAAEAAAQRLLREITQPIDLESFQVSVGVTIGLAGSNHGGTPAEMLLRNAELALYAARSEQRGTCRWYEASMESVLLERKALEHDLRLALLRGEFSLQYQPILTASDNTIVGYEALIRWHSPTRGRVSPADFIPFAEQHGLMVEIGDWVLRTACIEAAQWPGNLSVSVNLSPTQFRSSHLVQRICSVLQSTGLGAGRLELEITETAMMGDLATARSILSELRAMGVLVALDDFGTGYSSLSFLRILPFTRIKIDRSFIQDLGKTQESLAIVRAVTGLCSSLGVAATAEGVETEQQRAILRHEGCHELQGYLLGRPGEAPSGTADGDRLSVELPRLKVA